MIQTHLLLYASCMQSVQTYVRLANYSDLVRMLHYIYPSVQSSEISCSILQLEECFVHCVP